MTKTTIHAAKTNLSKLIAQAEAGGEVVILRDATPVARLVAFAAPSRGRVFGALADQITVPPSFFEPLPESELERWER